MGGGRRSSSGAAAAMRAVSRLMPTCEAEHRPALTWGVAPEVGKRRVDVSQRAIAAFHDVCEIL